MPKRDDEQVISETGNWNVAADFSKLKIMRYLFLADEYANICIFGHSTLIEELQNPIPPEELRMAGLKRLINCLITLIDNTVFAIKSKTDKEELTDKRKQLKRILDIIPLLGKTIRNDRINKRFIKIDEKKFNEIMEKLLSIKSYINEPLNKNHLIFVPKEDYDPSEAKKKYIEDAINRG